MKSLTATLLMCALVLLCASPTQPKPFSTNINTNYNNNYNSNLHTSYLISSLLNYILNLLQILHKNGESPGSGPYTIPAFPRPDELQNILQQFPPPPIQQPLENSADTGIFRSPVPSSSDINKGDFTTLYSHVFDHLVKNKKAGINKEDGSYLENSADGSYDYKKAVEDAVEAFKGPPVPPHISPVALGTWNPPQLAAVEEPPELKAAKMEFLRAFAEAQTRAIKKPDE